MKLGKTILVLIAENSSPVTQKAVQLFKNRIESRLDTTVKVGSLQASDESAHKANFAVIAGTTSDTLLMELLKETRSKPVKHPEGFALRVILTTPAIRKILPQAPAAIALIVGGGPRGVLYGIGKLLRLIQYEGKQAQLAPCARFESPAIPERCVYFATHFNNWYEGAPAEDVVDYVEELALWGFNSICTWFDANWYPENFDRQADSRGMKMIRLLWAIHQAARAVGMEVRAIGVANEGFHRQPPARLRADASGQRGGFYPYSQICPSKPGGLKMILKNRRRLLKLLGPIDVWLHWPYDQGGCGCSQCADSNHAWGKTFLKIGVDIAKLVREVNPGARVILSTWYMDAGERQQVYDLCQKGTSWFDGVIMQTEQAENADIPASYSKSVFPEISMFDCYFTSYGSNGANPAIRKFTKEARHTASLQYGAMLYSEGIYDDVNKVTWAALLWDPKTKPEDVAREYSGYYFGQRLEKQGADLLLALEQTWGAPKLSESQAATVSDIFKTTDAMRKLLPGTHASQLRWKSLWHRAKLDDLMKKVGSDMNNGVYRDATLLFQQAGLSDNAPLLRRAVRDFIPRLAQRNAAVQKLFDAYIEYLREFHLQHTTSLLFRPDAVVGSRDYTILKEALEKSLKTKDSDSFINHVLAAFKRWTWLNKGIDLEFINL